MKALKRSVNGLKRRFQRKRNVVYTSLFGFSEPFADHRYDDDSVDYICFTDDPTLTSSQWRMVHFENVLMDSHRLAKQFKHLPHLYLGDYQRSLYIDNTIRLKRIPSELFEEYPGSYTILKHPERDCIYDEAQVVMDAKYDTKLRVLPQMDFYRSLGYPVHNGLNSSGFLLRNHHDPRVQNVSADWHDQVLKFSKRDQLSWNVCAWHHKFDFRTLEKNPTDNDIFSWPVVSGDVRLPRDFEDNIYLLLNPDLRGAPIHPRLHYLKYGHAENRRYK